MFDNLVGFPNLRGFSRSIGKKIETKSGAGFHKYHCCCFSKKEIIPRLLALYRIFRASAKNFTFVWMARKSNQRKAKKSLFKRIALAIGKVLLWFFVFSIIWVLAYRFINPPITFLMVQRNWERKAGEVPVKVKSKWVKFEDISDNMKRAAVSAEDQLFLKHMGFDLKAIEKAYKSNEKKGKKKKKIKGGSTISQQTAKNVFLWPGRSYVRKAFEAYFTLLIELLWSKERILEVYLNVIEMGDGIYGAEAASQFYYGHSCTKMSKREAALLAACFPNPIRWSPNNATRYIKHRQYLIMRNMRRLGPLDF